MTHAAHGAARIGNVVNLAMGTWLIVSTFLWPHTADVRANVLIVGFLIAALAAAALIWSATSWVPVLPAVWLFGTSLWLDHQGAATPFNSAAVAAVVFLAALVPLAAPRPWESSMAHST
jgi:hypothetical protein